MRAWRGAALIACASMTALASARAHAKESGCADTLSGATGNGEPMSGYLLGAETHTYYFPFFSGGTWILAQGTYSEGYYQFSDGTRLLISCDDLKITVTGT